MFVIDKDGKLAYMGGIDDKATTNRRTWRPHGPMCARRST